MPAADRAFVSFNTIEDHYWDFRRIGKSFSQNAYC